MGTRLYVGNLAYSATEGDIRQLFEGVGQVVDCNLVIDRFTSKSRGFAFVEMATQDEANKAIAELGGKDFEGRSLTVNEARPREDRGGGGGGGGGGGRRNFSRDRDRY
jgi:RNA recognition motif-containing protein